MPKGIYEHKPIHTYVTLSDREYNRFKIALKMNKLSIRKFANRLGFGYGSLRVVISHINRQEIAEKYYNPIVKYTNDVYELIDEGINPKGMEVLKHRSLDLYERISYIGQEEIEQLIAETIPLLYEYLKSPDIIYLAIQSTLKTKIRKIRDYFIKLEYSVVKKIAHFENTDKGKKRSVVVLAANTIDKNGLMDEYKSCLEEVMATTKR